MGKSFRKKIFFSLGLLFFLFVLLFAYSRYRPYLQGASITELNIEDNQELEVSYFELKGVLHNAKTLYVNGVIVELEKDLSFNKTLVLPSGYSILELVYIDAFGREKIRQIPIYRKQ